MVENDGGLLRMTVDGETALLHEEDGSILGGGHDKVGFFAYTAIKVLNVKVYVKTLGEGPGLE
ncbi:MAG: hypothetical protein LC725_04790 [Lentisphaerae bacterium]|nr:hypothetical protein [Lentisphaerota bacterium]